MEAKYVVKTRQKNVADLCRLIGIPKELIDAPQNPFPDFVDEQDGALELKFDFVFENDYTEAHPGSPSKIYTAIQYLGDLLCEGGTHWDMTKAAADRIFPDKNVVHVISYGSSVVDYEIFDKPYVHAMTSEDDKTDTRAPSVAKFHEWVKKLNEHINAKETSKPQCLLLIGYVAHALQDLLVHKGVNDEEHATFDPDSNFDIPKVVDQTELLLKHFHELIKYGSWTKDDISAISMAAVQNTEFYDGHHGDLSLLPAAFQYALNQRCYQAKAILRSLFYGAKKIEKQAKGHWRPLVSNALKAKTSAEIAKVMIKA